LINQHSVRDRAAAPRIDTVRVVDMSGANSWVEFAGIIVTLGRRLSVYRARARQPRGKLKALVSEDVKEATGHGMRAGADEFTVPRAAHHRELHRAGKEVD
jgi:hypothetical protein